MCWSLLILGVCLSRRFFVLDGMVLNFGYNCCFINRFKPAVYKVNGVSSTWKMDVLLWNEKKGSLLGDFRHMKMILQ
jgi:hypothetical protein